MKKVLYIVLLIVAAGVGVFCYTYKNGGFKPANSVSQDKNKNQVENKADSEKTDKTSENFILYNGMEILIEPGVQEVSDMKFNDNTIKKYNTRYYNYEGGKYIGGTEGKFTTETYDGYAVVENVKRIAMSEKYEAIPREFKVIEELPEQLKEDGGYPDVKIHEIDLDGDGKFEHILCYNVDYDGKESEAEPEVFSGLMLFDENYEKIVDLVTLNNGFWGNIHDDERKIFITLDDIEYIDIDNDGIMEMIINVPTYDGTKISIVKYQNGEIEGDVDVQASVSP